MPDIPSKNPLRQKPKRYSEKRQLQKNKERGSSSDFSTLVDAIKSEGRAYRKEEQREDRGKKFREWVTIGFIGLTFLAICYQVHEMIKVYEPIRDQAIATDESAKATTRAANAATEQSKIASRQVENSEKAVVQAQRAWVGPIIAKIEAAPEIGKPLRVLVQYANSGREPALNFIYAGDVFAVTPEEEGNNVSAAKVEAFFKGCREATNFRAGQAVFPTLGSTEGGSMSFTTKEEFVDQPLIEGEKTLIAQGCFIYKSFNVIRHTYFCFFFNAKRSKIESLNYCTNGAGAD
jgi:hypothetical protein